MPGLYIYIEIQIARQVLGIDSFNQIWPDTCNDPGSHWFSFVQSVRRCQCNHLLDKFSVRRAASPHSASTWNQSQTSAVLRHKDFVNPWWFARILWCLTFRCRQGFLCHSLLSSSSSMVTMVAEETALQNANRISQVCTNLRTGPRRAPVIRVIRVVMSGLWDGQLLVGFAAGKSALQQGWQRFDSFLFSRFQSLSMWIMMNYVNYVNALFLSWRPHFLH